MNIGKSTKLLLGMGMVAFVAGAGAALSIVYRYMRDDHRRLKAMAQILCGDENRQSFTREIQNLGTLVNDSRIAILSGQAEESARAANSSAAILAAFNRQIEEYDREGEIRQLKLTLEQELNLYGERDYQNWYRKLQPVRDILQKKLYGSTQTLDGLRYALGKEGYVLSNLTTIEAPSFITKSSRSSFLALLELNSQLRRRNIDLIVAMFPSKEEVELDKFIDAPPDGNMVSPAEHEFMHELLAAGLEVIDLRREFMEKRGIIPGLFYKALDAHPADGAIRIAADAIARRLSRYGFVSAVQSGPEKYTCKEIQYVVPDGTPQFFPSTSAAAFQVLQKDGSFVPDDPNSPVLIAGDSFIGVPGNFGGGIVSADLVAHTAKLINQPVARLQQGAGAPHILTIVARADKSILAGKRVVVFCFGSLWLTPDRPWDVIRR